MTLGERAQRHPVHPLTFQTQDPWPWANHVPSVSDTLLSWIMTFNWAGSWICLPQRCFSIGIYLGSPNEGIVWEVTQMLSLSVTVITYFFTLSYLGQFVWIHSHWNSHLLCVATSRCCALDHGFYYPWQWIRTLHHRCLSFIWVLAYGKAY